MAERGKDCDSESSDDDCSSSPNGAEVTKSNCPEVNKEAYAPNGYVVNNPENHTVENNFKHESASSESNEENFRSHRRKRRKPIEVHEELNQKECELQATDDSDGDSESNSSSDEESDSSDEDISTAVRCSESNDHHSLSSCYKKDPNAVTKEKKPKTSNPDECKRDDFVMPRLFRTVIDTMMSRFRIRESDVTDAIHGIRYEIKMAHRRSFRKFPGINFDDPAYCCAYLRRYAACHTGLVKEAMWNFLRDSGNRSTMLKFNIFSQKHLNVISLGGGPGNDMVGFCSALQEAGFTPESIGMTIADINKGWCSYFPAIVEAATKSDFCSISEFFKTVPFTTSFLNADLADPESSDGALKQSLAEADMVLMVKLLSFLSKKQAGIVLTNVIGSMKPDSALIFIDTPFPRKVFKKLKSKIGLVYRAPQLEYKFTFKPSKYHFPCIRATQGDVYVYRKKNGLWNGNNGL